MKNGKRLLDLFCGAGGASMGYHRAGFCVTGVDIEPQKNHPFEFVQADALSLSMDFLRQFDAIHASPPCQAYSISRNNGCHKNAPELIVQTRDLLRAIGKPYIIENVVGAPLFEPIMLCGASFGLGASGMDLPRHRLFELSFTLLAPPCVHRRGQTIGVYGSGTNSWHKKKIGRCLKVSEMKEAMGIYWMTHKELTQAIPPAYTEWIGGQLLRLLT